MTAGPGNADTLTKRILNSPNHRAVSLLIKQSKVDNSVRCQLEQSLVSPIVEKRVIALAHLGTQCAYGANPPTAIVIGGPLLSFVEKNIRSLQFTAPISWARMKGNISRSLARALYLEGKFRESIAIVDEAQSSHPYRPALHEEDRLELDGVKILSLIRIFDLKTAEEAYALLPSSTRFNSLDPVKGALRQMVISLFELPEPRSLRSADSHDEKFYQIFVRNSARQKEDLRLIRESFMNTMAQSPERDMKLSQVDQMKGLLDQIDEIVISSLNYAEKVAKAAGKMAEFQRLARLLMNVDYDAFPRVNLDVVNKTMTETLDLLVGNGDEPAKHELHHRRLNECLKWTRKTGDIAGRMELTWCKAILKENKASGDRGARLFHDLFTMLRAQKQRDNRLVAQAALGSYFPGLTLKLARHPNQRVSMAAAEFRRGMTVAQTHRNTCGFPSIFPERGPQIETASVHYLAFSYFSEEDSIYSYLRLLNGKTYRRRTEINGTTLRSFEGRFDPSTSSKPDFFSSGQSEPYSISLSPLISILEEPFSKGFMKKGDHILVAAESPIHVVPVHCIDFKGNPAIYSFSFSRVHSWADAKRLMSSKPYRPEKAELYFVPAENERNTDRKRKEFHGLVHNLETHVNSISVAEDCDASRGRFLNQQVQRGCLFHLQAHGWFPESELAVNPFDQAGILLSDGKSLPLRTANSSNIVSPKAIHDSGVDFSGSHITLAACVSGLGRPGQGGDVLGMEFAFSVRGASSVLASHWHLHAVKSIQFTQNFYDLWLGQKLSRAESYRLTMMRLMKKETMLNEQLHWGAFSLFGEWR